MVEAIYIKNTCYLHTGKHREIGHELMENTGNLILT